MVLVVVEEGLNLEGGGITLEEEEETVGEVDARRRRMGVETKLSFW